MSIKKRNIRSSSCSISVWKKDIGPNLKDIFLRRNLEVAKDGERNKQSDIYPNRFINQKRHHNDDEAEDNSLIEDEEERKKKKNQKFMNFLCRDKFIFDENITCFPNYMHKSSLNIKKKIDICDLIIEVRDARLPFTSTNDFIIDSLRKHRKEKKRIIILNKIDLISKGVAVNAKNIIEEKTKHMCILISSKYNKNISKIRDICKEIKPKFKSLGIFAMLIGLPNVGKSSIINSFKDITYNLGKYGHKNNKISFEVNRKKAKTNVIAGTTKIIDTYKVSNTPLLYFIDTPGIYLPKMEDKEISLKLSAIGNALDYKYDHMYVGDYILFTLNKHKNFNYVKMIGLEQPTNDIRFVSNVISTKLNLCRNYKYLDINGGCRYFIDMFRLGLFGHICLDTVPHSKEDFITYFDFNSQEPLAIDAQNNPQPFRGLL
ncbi:GTP-binding protein [Plasmodium gonderi]|uniref:GTP-binding protein n=1 Tax=Plasmodium gonderi TaxID=77519 RepID=A0A1Y1JK88_PLAGO|nr:GTP-binding protein [Plasmodium gonderi]GAW82871.1 GTP-binding protein [Plasmodium gonderi]